MRDWRDIVASALPNSLYKKEEVPLSKRQHMKKKRKMAKASRKANRG